MRDQCRVHGKPRCERKAGSTSMGDHCAAHERGCEFTPPRPDYRWVAGEGPRRHEPQRVPRRLPAPPRAVVMVPSDIALAVAEYAEELDRWYDNENRRIYR